MQRNQITNERFEKRWNHNKTEKRCNACKAYLAVSQFDKQSQGLKSKCKACLKKRGKELSRKNKQIMVDYLGGKCQQCGYNDCIAALDFHHRNPDDKTMQLNKQTKNLMTERIFRELDKCQLLCANCHRVEHYKK